MKKVSWGMLAVLGVFLIFVLNASGQATLGESGLSGSSASTTNADYFRGATLVDKAGYFEAADAIHINISSYSGTKGQPLYVNTTNLFPSSKTYTCGVQIDDIKVLGFAEGTSVIFEETVYNTTVEEDSTTLPNGTVIVNRTVNKVNETTVLVERTKWAEVETRDYSYDGRTFTGIDITADSKEVTQLKTVLAPKTPFAPYVEYSWLCNASGVFVDFDPILDDNLVSYWALNGDYVDSYGNSDLAPYGTTHQFLSAGGINSQYYNATDAGDDVLTVGTVQVKDTLSNSSWSMSFWFQKHTTAQDNIINQYQGSGDNGFFIKARSTSNIWTDVGIHGDIPSIENVRTTWSNFILVRNSSGMTVFINGTSVLLRSVGTIGLSYNLTYLCGQVSADVQTCVGLPGSDVGMNGRIDEIGLWNRAFDQTDANDIWNAGTGLFCTGDPCSFVPVTNANETEGDDAIQTAIDSSVPSATKHKTQQVYIVNSSDSQWQGTADYLVVQASPQRRWVLNYVTSGESYLNAANLSSSVYVLELANMTIADITQAVSTLLNATK